MTPDFLSVVYAALVAIEERKVDEVEVEHRVVNEDDNTEETVTFIARRTVTAPVAEGVE